MYPAGHHPIYSYTMEDRQEILAGLGITESQLKKDIETITDWFYKQPHLSEAGIHPHIIQQYLIGSKGSVEVVKRRIDKSYRLRHNVPEFFGDRIKLLNNIDRPIWETHMLAPMPKLYKGQRITVAKTIDLDNFEIEDAVLNVFLTTDIRFLNDCFNGDIWVADLKGFNLSNLLKVNVVALAKCNNILHEGLGLRIVNIHIVNCSNTNLAQNVISLIKHFVSKKILGRILFHETLEELHKYLPKEYLPKDYGGEQPTMDEFREKYETLITSEKTKQLLIDACKFVSDETKRPKSEYSEDNLQGNFKKLELD